MRIGSNERMEIVKAKPSWKKMQKSIKNWNSIWDSKEDIEKI